MAKLFNRSKNCAGDYNITVSYNWNSKGFETNKYNVSSLDAITKGLSKWAIVDCKTKEVIGRAKTMKACIELAIEKCNEVETNEKVEEMKTEIEKVKEMKTEMNKTLKVNIENAKKELSDNNPTQCESTDTLARITFDTFTHDIIPLVIEYIIENEDLDFINHGLSDLISEHADSATPIYYKDIDEIWSEYRQELLDVYHEYECSNDMQPIYFLIEKELHSLLHSLSVSLDDDLCYDLNEFIDDVNSLIDECNLNIDSIVDLRDQYSELTDTLSNDYDSFAFLSITDNELNFDNTAYFDYVVNREVSDIAYSL